MENFNTIAAWGELNDKLNNELEIGEVLNGTSANQLCLDNDMGQSGGNTFFNEAPAVSGLNNSVMNGLHLRNE